MKVTAENGHQYDLDRMAINELHKAQNAADAEAIYNRFAPHVPARDRLGIWIAVDGYLEMEAASYGPAPLG